MTDEQCQEDKKDSEVWYFYALSDMCHWLGLRVYEASYVRCSQEELVERSRSLLNGLGFDEIFAVPMGDNPLPSVILSQHPFLRLKQDAGGEFAVLL